MSVLNPIIDSIDPVNRLIYLKGSATWPPSKIIDGKLVWNPVDDIYTEVRRLRRLDESLRPYDIFCEALPLIEKSPGIFTGRALVLRGGTRIIPADETQTQDVTGELLSDEGISGADLIDLTSLSVGTKVKINYAPPPATEVIGNEEIQNQSYLFGRVFINTVLGNALGNGTPTNPIDSLQNALPIATKVKLQGFDVTGTIVCSPTDDIVSKKLFGQTPLNSAFIATGVDATMTYFERIFVQGDFHINQSAAASFDTCVFGPITNFFGGMSEGIVTDNIQLNPNATGDIYVLSSRSGVAGNQRFIFDVNGASVNLIFRDWQGGITLRGMTQGFASFDGQGRIEIENTNTGGEIAIGGNWRVTNNTGGATIVDDSNVQNLVWRGIQLP